MARTRPGDLSGAGLRPRGRPVAAGAWGVLCALLPAGSALEAQELLFARMEDAPALARLLADAVEAGRLGGTDALARMAPHLIEAAAGQRSGQIGLVLERLALAARAGRGAEPGPLEKFADALFLHALPEVQDAGAGARIHLTARLLLPLELPRGLALKFRLRDPLTGRLLAERALDRALLQEDLLAYQVTTAFDLQGCAPGRWLAEAELSAPDHGTAAMRPNAFHLLAGFKAALERLARQYAILRKDARHGEALACLEALLGELQRPIHPARGEPPRLESDLAARLAQASAWSERMVRGLDPFAGLQGDLLLGVRSEQGVVMPLRVFVPPGLPSPGLRRGLLFLPDATGCEGDLADLHGRGRLPALAARHCLVVACLQSGYVRQGGDVIGPARELLERRLGVGPGAVTIGGQGRGASQAFYAALADPARWAGLVLVSGPPADPARLAPIPGGRTLYLEGAADPGLRYLAAAEEAASRGLLRFLKIPGAEHYLALSTALDRVLEHAAAPATAR